MYFLEGLNKTNWFIIYFYELIWSLKILREKEDQYNEQILRLY